MFPTPLQKLNLNLQENDFYMKRDDLIGFSFGGNKYRKAVYYFTEIENGGYDAVVTSGSHHSNHCRIVANMAAQKGIPCYLVSPAGEDEQAMNSVITDTLGAIRIVAEHSVKESVEDILENLKNEGRNPYYIKNGGHGILGTMAYKEAYDEIRAFERDTNIHFDYIFFADGTGTTHAGLLSGKILAGDQKEIVGISVSRDYDDGANTVKESVNAYMEDLGKPPISLRAIHYCTDYLLGGYSKYGDEVLETIQDTMRDEGIPLDPVYTGKAFYGMKEFVKKDNIRQKNILFIHTGGAPIYFDALRKIRR